MFIEAVTAEGGSEPTQQFFQKWWNKPLNRTRYLSRTQPVIEQASFKDDRKTLNNLVFQALGSNFNRAEFVLCEKGINAFKERVWSKSSPMDDKKFQAYAEDAAIGGIGSDLFLTGIRTVGSRPAQKRTRTNSSSRHLLFSAI